jgi:hypothetical protein
MKYELEGIWKEFVGIIEEWEYYENQDIRVTAEIRTENPRNTNLKVY